MRTMTKKLAGASGEADDSNDVFSTDTAMSDDMSDGDTDVEQRQRQR